MSNASPLFYEAVRLASSEPVVSIVEALRKIENKIPGIFRAQANVLNAYFGKGAEEKPKSAPAKKAAPKPIGKCTRRGTVLLRHAYWRDFILAAIKKAQKSKDPPVRPDVSEAVNWFKKKHPECKMSLRKAYRDIEWMTCEKQGRRTKREMAEHKKRPDSNGNPVFLKNDEWFSFDFMIRWKCFDVHELLYSYSAAYWTELGKKITTPQGAMRVLKAEENRRKYHAKEPITLDRAYDDADQS